MPPRLLLYWLFSSLIRSPLSSMVTFGWFVLSFKRSAYLKVLSVWSAEILPGLIHAIITILDLFDRDMKESRSTNVSLDARNGTC